jgi:tRNA pseudouridine synthase 10
LENSKNSRFQKRGKILMTDDMLEKAQTMLEKYPLCNHCLGRQFALLGYGLNNQKRGEALKLLLTMKAHQLALDKNKTGISSLKILASNGSFDMATQILKKMKKKVNEKKVCHLCGGSFNTAQDLANRSVSQLQHYEYATFLVGVELPNEVEEREDEFKAEFEVKHGESMRNSFSREVGKKIAEATGKLTDYNRPDIVVLVDPFKGQISLQVNPLHISGRYRKIMRGIPQSRWLCSKCRGKGCKNCNWTGKMYPDSVEEFIGEPVREQTMGEEIALHGAGREDIDARMLGRGRPFVIEVKKPKKRFIDLRSLTKTINERAQGKVQVSNLRFANKDLVRKLKKKEAAEKEYKVMVEFGKPVDDKQLSLLEKSLVNAVVKQQTPQRVLHRRADLVREKHIYEAKVKKLSFNRIELKLRCQGGLYIKELVTGDNGRTIPNVAEIVGVKAVPLDLDVLSVLMKKED